MIVTREGLAILFQRRQDAHERFVAAGSVQSKPIRDMQRFIDAQARFFAVKDDYANAAKKFKRQMELN